jgi:signal transduction histidine kinase
MELAIFRIVQESLTNVRRHSGSTSASVKLSIDDQHVQLAIADAGKGISRESLQGGASRGVGIRGMRERALHLQGELEICSNQPGTTVRVTLPIPNKKSADLDIKIEERPRTH